MNIEDKYQNDLIQFIFQKPGSRLAIEQFPDVQRSIDLYRNNLFENAYRALAITFPTVEFLIGRRAFRTLIINLLQSEQKTQFDWADYGASFPQCIAEQEDLTIYPYMSEVAEFDWLVHQTERIEDVYADESSFSLLQSSPLSKLEFILSSGFKLKEFWFPVAELRRLATDHSLKDAEKEALQKNTTTEINNVRKLEQPRSYLVWRPEYKYACLEIENKQVSIYQRLCNGATAEEVFAEVESKNLDLSTWLSELITTKKVIGIKPRS